MRNTLILAAIAALAFTSVANAKACKDAKGHFMKCPAPAAAPMTPMAAKGKAAPCKDAKGHFMKCGPATVTNSMTTTVQHPSGAMSSMTTTSKTKVCHKGKPCGNTCISMNDTCHK